ncbi:MAG: T9SS C-terminal target domain-containing protein [Flavobacteriia bacterium]|nr:T9SS C-terminal target domain-containing protein [Flavobacteriia bacterium]
MKKIYICLLGFFTASAFTAQVQNSNFSPLERKNSHLVGQIKPSKLTQNTKETILWSNSFNTPSDWVINNTAGTPGLGWGFSSNPAAIPVTQLSPFASTTAANGFLFVNSDANNTADFDGTFINTTATTSATINLTGQPVVRLRYQHNFRWWHDTRGVSVSADNGATWTDFEMSNETDYSLPNQNAGNPEQTVIDISSIAGNQAQVKIRFYYNDNDYWAWYWAVDDVALFVPEDNDLVMLGGYWGSTGAWGARLPYYQIPLSQLAPLDVAGIVKNYGALDQNDVVFTAALASGVWSGSSAPEAVLTGATDTISLTGALTPPPIVATHVINMSVTSSATDAVPADNSILAAASVSVNNYIYARDKGTATNGTYNQGMGFEAGNVFDIYAAANLSGIDAYIATNAVAGAEVYAKLYSVDPSATTTAAAFVFVDESTPYILTAADLGQKITLALSAGAAPLSAGVSYVVVLGSYGDGGATNDLVISTAGVSEASTSYYYDMTDNTWYYTTSTPMVRMNFDPSVGVNEVEDNLGLRVFPNPANEVINISLNKEVSATLTLLDVSGKVVRTQTLNGISTSINTASLNSGVYFVTINDGTSVSTQKVVIKK